ncbi:hypothetical protein POJ06DRAFT_263935 [Lipomyces tetrasporus]|uniref:Uncharacterized protein n=1 Tax=Lipomyces tetrasporus TaxID=54092 RepID=A0AAD7QJZ9_9ASCO|nr:uncharacterized protein POJ06DRAFT_263935 [Lipomyces tetrasporus]KAJ8096586.1 hypothetical protein POJ06DRAFT_263935 [Lipomyces tetrasporus]
MYFPNTIWSVSFLVVVFVEAAVVLAFEGYVFGKFEANINANIDSAQRRDSNTVAIPTYLALFIFGEVYQLVLSWDALRLKNTIQVIGLCMFNTAVLVYAGIQYEQIKQAASLLSAMRLDDASDGYVLASSAWGDMKPFLIAIIGVIAVAGFVMAYICFQLYREFGWTIYKQIGADLRMKHRYLAYQIFMTLLKFDVFFFLGFTIQFVVIVLNRKDVEFALTIAVIPLTIVVLVITTMSVRRESYVGMVSMIVIFFAGMAYFLFKLVRMYQPLQAIKYVAARKSLTVFAAITLFLILVTIINAIVCTANFRKGLKPYVYKAARPSWLATHEKRYGGGHDEITSTETTSPVVRRRMSLD